MQDSNIVCFCNGIYEKEIMQVLKKFPDADVSFVQRHTRAGTTCGKCLPVLDSILMHHKDEIKKNPTQLRIKF